MIFQHTLPLVLRGEKTATSRIWKPKYVVHQTALAKQKQLPFIERVTSTKGRTLYYVGQRHKVQYKRGKSAVLSSVDTTDGKPTFFVPGQDTVKPDKHWEPVRIEITELQLRDVRYYDDDLIEMEGFEYAAAFYETWLKMHDPEMHKQLDLALFDQHPAFRILSHRPDPNYTALLIKFKLVPLGEPR